MKHPSIMVVLSGGQDSTTVLAWAMQHFPKENVHAISFEYNQRHSIELQCAVAVGKISGVASHEIVRLGPILQGTSPLVDHSGQNKLETYDDYESMDKIIGDRVEKTFVPMRNALFLTVAANRAICRDVFSLATGVCQADNANYPDCRASFIESQERTICEALGSHFTIQAPLMNMSKAESIHYMARINALPWLAFTHTAYDGRYPPTGKDHASVLRAHGFETAGMPDPLVLRAATIDGAMDLPSTDNYSNAELNRRLVNKIEALRFDLNLVTPAPNA